MSNSRLLKLHRVTELFHTGTELVLNSDPENLLIFWIGKLNSFEEEECRKDGVAARTRVVTRVKDAESDEHDVLYTSMSTLSIAELIDSIVQAKISEDSNNAVDDVEAEEEWQDMREYLRRENVLLNDEGASDDDPRREHIKKKSDEYWETVTKFSDKRQAQRRNDLRDLTREDLEEQYVEAYQEIAGLASYLKERRVSEVYYALRECAAIPGGESGGEWDHTACTHDRFLSTRAEVRTLPDEFLERVKQALDNIMVPPKEAGN